jgi:hypothetical protein
MPSRVDSGATCAQRRDGSPRCAVAIPFEIGPLQPSYVARPEAVPPGPPEALPYPIRRRLSSTSESGAARRSAWPGRRTRWGHGGAALGRGGAQMLFEFPTKFFLRIGALIPISQRFGPRTDTTSGYQPTDAEQSVAVYGTDDNVTS